MKPVGSSGISDTEPKKNKVAAAMVLKRCDRHQRAQTMYIRSQRASLGVPTMGLSI